MIPSRRIVWLSHLMRGRFPPERIWSGRKIVIFLHAFADECSIPGAVKGDELEAVGFAVCVSSLEKWDEYQEKHAALLDEFSVTGTFHTSQLYDCDNPKRQSQFTGWDRKKVAGFLERQAAIVDATVDASIATSIIPRDWDATSDADKLAFLKACDIEVPNEAKRIDELTLICASNCFRWMFGYLDSKEDCVAAFAMIDRGSQQFDLIRREVHRIHASVEDAGRRDRLKVLVSEEDDQASPQIIAADLLAYEIAKQAQSEVWITRFRKMENGPGIFFTPWPRTSIMDKAIHAERISGSVINKLSIDFTIATARMIAARGRSS